MAGRDYSYHKLKYKTDYEFESIEPAPFQSSHQWAQISSMNETILPDYRYILAILYN